MTCPADPGESVNVAARHPEVVDRLELSLRRAWESLLAGHPDPAQAADVPGGPGREWLERAKSEQRLGINRSEAKKSKSVEGALANGKE